MTTTTELQAFLAPANDLTERDLNDAIEELIELALHKFGKCYAVDSTEDARADGYKTGYDEGHDDGYESGVDDAY